MKKTLFLMAGILSVLLSGCASSRELNSLALVNSIFYDLKGDDTVSVEVEVLNPAASGGSTESKGNQQTMTLMLPGEGKTSVEALESVAESFERKLYYPHVEVRFFTEKLARKGLAPFMDFLMRDYNVRESADIVIVKGDNADKLYSASTGLSDSIGDFMVDLADSQPHMTSDSFFTDTLGFMRSYYLDGVQPVTGVVEIVKDEGSESSEGGSSKGQNGGQDKYKIRYAGIAAFKNDRLVGYLEKDEARAYNFLTENIKNATISVPFEDGYTVVRATGAKTGVKVEFSGQDVLIRADVKTTLSVTAEEGEKNVDDAGTLRKIEQKFDEMMKDELESVIKKVQKEYGSDIFGFGKSAHTQNPKIWGKIKGDWDSFFSGAKITVSVKSEINRSGKITQPFKVEF